MTILGIDLGTTNSACAIWRDGKVELIPNRLGEWLTPSAVFLDADDKLIVGQTARERSVTDPAHTASVFKRYMGTNRKIKLGKKTFSATELSAMVLKSLKDDAEQYLGETITQAVISVPAYFNDTQRKATVLAGELADLKVERLINEPTAAAMTYGLHEKPEHTQFMVIDLGGGTFDVSIMEYFDGVLEVHASSGDNFLGGEDFLEILVNKYLATFNLTKSHLDSQDLQKVYTKLEQLKRLLNTQETVNLEPFIEEQKENFILTRNEFEALAQPLLTRIQSPIETTLRDAEIKPWDLDEVVLVGGATRMRFFRGMIAKMFRRMPSANMDPDLVITMGAAIQAGLKAKDKMLDDVVLTDVCPYSLGTSTVNESDATGDQGGLFSAIIERNTIIPASRTERYFTVSDNQKELQIEIYQGESRLVSNNIKLGEVTVKIPKNKKYEESVDVRFSYDMNGLLEVDITVVSTGEKHYKMIKNASGELSEKEIQTSKDKLAKMKFHPRELAVNQNLVSRADRIFESRLSDEREAIKDSLRWFEGILDTQDERQIKVAQQEFAVFLDKFEQDGFF